MQCSNTYYLRRYVLARVAISVKLILARGCITENDFMKVLVKRLITEEFLTTTGSWTQNLAEARDFKTSTDATTFCTVHAVEDSELVVELPQRELVMVPYSQTYSHQDQPLNDY